MARLKASQASVSQSKPLRLHHEYCLPHMLNIINTFFKNFFFLLRVLYTNQHMSYLVAIIVITSKDTGPIDDVGH